MPDIIEDIVVVDGVAIRTVHAPESLEYKARARHAITQKLTALDQITGPRWAEGLLRGTTDQFVLDGIAAKEALRLELAALNE